MNKLLSCPECKSTDLKRFGKKFHCNNDGQRTRVQQYQCNKCGRITIKPKALPFRDNLGRFAKATTRSPCKPTG